MMNQTEMLQAIRTNADRLIEDLARSTAEGQSSLPLAQAIAEMTAAARTIGLAAQHALEEEEIHE